MTDEEAEVRDAQLRNLRLRLLDCAALADNLEAHLVGKCARLAALMTEELREGEAG